jgi:hypothetical protein
MIWFADDFHERPGLRNGPGQVAERLRTGFAWLEGKRPEDEVPVRNLAPHRLPPENKTKAA